MLKIPFLPRYQGKPQKQQRQGYPKVPLNEGEGGCEGQLNEGSSTSWGKYAQVGGGVKNLVSDGEERVLIPHLEDLDERLSGYQSMDLGRLSVERRKLTLRSEEGDKIANLPIVYILCERRIPHTPTSREYIRQFVDRIPEEEKRGAVFKELERKHGDKWRDPLTHYRRQYKWSFW